MTFINTESYMELERLLTTPLKNMQEEAGDKRGVTKKGFSPELDAHISSLINAFCNHVEESVRTYPSKGDYIIDLRKLSRKISEMADTVRSQDDGKQSTFFHWDQRKKLAMELKTEIDNWIGIVINLPPADLPFKKTG